MVNIIKINGMDMVQLNKVERMFLAKYRPEDAHWTSVKEIENITNALGLNNLSGRELIAMRNAVVEYYSNRIELETQDHEKQMRWMTSMQSVTAVIDDISVKKYGRI